MARLPNADRAVIDRRKLEHYCLSAVHPRGRHKARVFRSRLGIGPEHAGWLEAAIRGAVISAEAIEGRSDSFGRQYLCDLRLARAGRTAIVRTIWLVRQGEVVPRLVTCYVA